MRTNSYLQATTSGQQKALTFKDLMKVPKISWELMDQILMNARDVKTWNLKWDVYTNLTELREESQGEMQEEGLSDSSLE